MNTQAPFLDLLLHKYDNKKYYDLSVDPKGDLTKSSSLATQILVSLYTEKRAEASEVAFQPNRRGWWGNEALSDTNVVIGSKLWLLEQRRLTLETANLAVDYTSEALQWMVDEGHVDDVQVTAERNFKKRAIELNIQFFKDGIEVPIDKFNPIILLKTDIT